MHYDKLLLGFAPLKHVLGQKVSVLCCYDNYFQLSILKVRVSERKPEILCLTFCCSFGSFIIIIVVIMIMSIFLEHLSM